MKRFVSALLFLSIFFATIPCSNSSIVKDIPKGFNLSNRQFTTLLSYKDQIYYTLILEDPTSKETGYLFFDTENLPVLDPVTYQVLAQNAFLIERIEQIRDMVYFGISETSILASTKRVEDVKITQPDKQPKILDLTLIESVLRKFCLGSENILLYSLIDAGKLTESADRVVFLGTMKWAMRRSSWQNYWNSHTKMDTFRKNRENSPKLFTCLDTQIQTDPILNDLFLTIFFGNLYLDLNDKNREQTLWKSLYEIMTPYFNKSAFSLASQLSDVLYQEIQNSAQLTDIRSTFLDALSFYSRFLDDFEQKTNPELVGSLSHRILVSLTPKVTSMFRLNAKRTGKSLYIGPTTEKLAWKKKLGDWVVSSPVVLEDQSILVGCFDGNMYHLSSTGEILWKFYAGSWIVSTPAVGGDGTIYFGNQNGFLLAVSQNGELVWKVNLGSMVGSSPAITGSGDILVGTFDGSMVCVKPIGEIRWKYKTGSWILSSPAIMDNGNIVFGSTDHHVYCLSPSGVLLWKYKTGNMVVGSPAIDDRDRIYIGSLDTNLYCLSQDGQIIWKYTASSWIISSPAIGSNNQVYFAEKNGTIHSLDEAGKQQWMYTVNGVIEASPLLDQHDTLYITSWDRRLYAIQKGELLWKFSFESESRSTPTLSESGTLYVGVEDQYIYAFTNQ